MESRNTETKVTIKPLVTKKHHDFKSYLACREEELPGKEGSPKRAGVMQKKIGGSAPATNKKEEP